MYVPPFPLHMSTKCQRLSTCCPRTHSPDHVPRVIFTHAFSLKDSTFFQTAKLECKYILRSRSSSSEIGKALLRECNQCFNLKVSLLFLFLLFN